MSNFTGGKLKIKGGDLPGLKKKKKKSDAAALALALANPDAEGGDGSNSKAADAADELKKTLHGHALSSDDTQDRRTAAEKKYDERMKTLETERLRKMAEKSHR